MRSKPASLGCRVKTEDKKKFIEKCRELNKTPQQIIESLILWWLKL
jgi:hypothetical protein